MSSHTRTSNRWVTSGQRGYAGGAFSLIELMVAIIILGLGLIMVATVFPVAWGRARTLSEATSHATISATAHATVTMLAHVDGPETPGGPPSNRATFAGDLVIDNSHQVNPYTEIVTVSDTRVHHLYMENMLVAPRGFIPDRRIPWYDDAGTGSWTDPPAPWSLERVVLIPADPLNPHAGGMTAEEACDANPTPLRDYCRTSFLASRIRFEQRVYPPLPPRDPNVTGVSGGFNAADPLWDGMFNTRRFAWAVFHRLRGRIGPDPYCVAEEEFFAESLEAAGSIREFDVYYVTLRRPQPTFRYAQQDREPINVPNPWILPATPQVTPQAAPHTDDVMLPEPWRVQIQITAETLPTADPDDDYVAGMATTGIPTEIRVPPEDIPANEPAAIAMLTQMFQRGTRLIDERTGLVYRVTRRRLGEEGQVAFLTLDREITFEDVNMPPLCEADPNYGSVNPATLDPVERLRTVWVFPPPVLPRTDDRDRFPVFDGPQPVVDIEVRTLSLAPHG